MDPRDNKPRDFVAAIRNLKEEIKKTRAMQMMWFQTYGPLLDEYENVKKKMTELYEKKHVAVTDDSSIKDERSCLPTPETSNREYGWLAMKPEFQLEKYGSYTIDRIYPMKTKTLLQGNIPILAPGKSLI
ncbi:uncharacterized protein LOC122525608 [Polistes fuscatus]|uniref:uncharacterized protein LOC122525608 n=1 Tax=Polistes fuscatus TaxID=30207 RepID=UPI001CA8B118|nr:uncharacterized protein LOC122525608 [Polistes fuscatus]